MDYETPDGSQFSLREIWTDDSNDALFRYTSISAHIEGHAYCGKIDERLDEIDDAEILNSLEPVPSGCVHPRYEEGFSVAPAFDSLRHYLKAPSFTWEDCRPGVTFAADCFLNEIKVLERLRESPHPNIVRYYGCVIGNRAEVTRISLEKVAGSLASYVETRPGEREIDEFMRGIEDGISHLHQMGLAHNDLNPNNIRVDENGAPVIIDFDSCLPFGYKLMKGLGCACAAVDDSPTSSKDNDFFSMDMIFHYIQGHQSP